MLNIKNIYRYESGDKIGSDTSVSFIARRKLFLDEEANPGAVKFKTTTATLTGF